MRILNSHVKEGPLNPPYVYSFILPFCISFNYLGLTVYPEFTIILWSKHYYDTHYIEEKCGIIKIVLVLASNRRVKYLIYHLLTMWTWALNVCLCLWTSIFLNKMRGDTIPHRVIGNFKNIGISLANITQWLDCWPVHWTAMSSSPQEHVPEFYPNLPIFTPPPSGSV